MTRIEQTINHAEAQCKANGTRLTTKRKQVLSQLLKTKKAVSAYELIDSYKEEFNETLQAMSMYRILDFLQNEHLAHKLKLANKYVACSHIRCKHEHETPQFLICGQCQKVKEMMVSQSIINELQDNIEKEGFYLINQQLEMNCICQSCQKSKLN